MWGATPNGYRVTFQGDENALQLDGDDNYMNILKSRELYTLKE